MGSVFSEYLCNQKAAGLRAKEVEGGGLGLVKTWQGDNHISQWSSSALEKENEGVVRGIHIQL